MAAPKSSSTFELLRWSDEPSRPPPHTPVRPQATGGIGSILLGAAVTAEEAEALHKKKPNSELKKKEMSGSGIFSMDGDGPNTPFSADKPGVRIHQPAGGASQILFSEVGSISPKKPTSIPEVAKQRELSGNLEAPTEEIPSRKPTSTSKVKELVGSDIFGPPPVVPPRSVSRNHESEDVITPLRDLSLNPSKFVGFSLAAFGNEDLDLSAKKCNTHKVAELSGNNIFKEGAPPSLAPAEKSLSAAKRKEITGNDIFGDEKPVLREHFGGIRKPPGGGSSLTLV